MEEMLPPAGPSSTQQISSTGSSLATDGVPRSRRQPQQHCDVTATGDVAVEEKLPLGGPSSTQQISSTGSSLATDGVPRSRR